MKVKAKAKAKAKAIKIDPRSGRVDEFIMNDKCAAGTGRFLEKVAGLLGITVDELGQAALRSTTELAISSQCVVFAESEVISVGAFTLAAGAFVDRFGGTFVCAIARLPKPTSQRRISLFMILLSLLPACQSASAPGWRW